MDTKEIKKKNKNLIDAKKNKNDEFYTRYEDVANELKWYKEQLKDKPLLFPCDYNFYTEFTKEEQNIIFNGGVADSKNDLGSFSRFIINMQDENSKNSWNNKLYFSHYNPKTNEGTPFQESIREFAKKHPDGVVISNPPFSLFREFIDVVMECNLKFLIIGSMNTITYKETFKHIKENKLWLGYNSVKQFRTSDGGIKNFGNICWFTNLDTEKRHIELPLSYSYKDNPTKYPKYDNYDAINVDKVKEIPCDYDRYIGVPISFLEKYNPEQFEILGISATNDRNVDIIRTDNINTNRGVINGKELYARIIIKNKQPEL